MQYFLQLHSTPIRLTCEEYIGKMQWRCLFANFRTVNREIALQVAKKITLCDSALKLVCHMWPIRTKRNKPYNQTEGSFQKRKYESISETVLKSTTGPVLPVTKRKS